MRNSTVFKHLFTDLKAILARYSKELDIVTDGADTYFLNTHFIMKNNKPLHFGAVKINKNYVSFHLMPIYVFPELKEGMSKQLAKRMQGKSCFNFKESDTELFKELTDLSDAGFRKYKNENYVQLSDAGNRET